MKVQFSSAVHCTVSAVFTDMNMTVKGASPAPRRCSLWHHLLSQTCSCLNWQEQKTRRQPWCPNVLESQRLQCVCHLTRPADYKRKCHSRFSERRQWYPLAVAVYVIAVVRLQGTDDGPVLADGHLGLVKVNGEHGFLHVGAVAQPIGVNVMPLF